MILHCLLFHILLLAVWAGILDSWFRIGDYWCLFLTLLYLEKKKLDCVKNLSSCAFNIQYSNLQCVTDNTDRLQIQYNFSNWHYSAIHIAIIPIDITDTIPNCHTYTIQNFQAHRILLKTTSKFLPNNLALHKCSNRHAHISNFYQKFSVRWGITICVLHLAPRVPDSKSGFWKYTFLQ